MTITVSTGAEFLAAAEGLFKQKIERALPKAQTEIVAKLFQTWSDSSWTWSKHNPAKVWSGQSRGSINVSVGSPDPSYLPDNPGPWPMHPHPYPPKDVFEIKGHLASLAPYQIVYLSDNAPHVDKVEAHNHIAHAAAVFTIGHFKDHSWAASLNAP